MAVGDGAHGRHDPHFPIEQLFRTPEERALLAKAAESIPNAAGVMVRARRIVEDHIEAYGMVPAPDKLKEAIAMDLGFVQLSSIPYRKRPVAWRVSTGQSKWCFFDDEEKANALVEETGGLMPMQGLYVRDGK